VNAQNVNAADVVGLLAEEERLRVYAAVVLGAATPQDVLAVTDLPLRAVTRALLRLTQGGLVSRDDTGLSAGPDVFKEVARQAAAAPEPEPLDPDRTRAAVLRSFIKDGRLISIPTSRAKRLIVLEHLAAAFEPGVRYPEKEVNAVLRAWHDDHAALRRYLVDEGLFSREPGVYWRSGGPFPI
jgi:hypothetical protein